MPIEYAIPSPIFGEAPSTRCSRKNSNIKSAASGIVSDFRVLPRTLSNERKVSYDSLGFIVRAATPAVHKYLRYRLIIALRDRDLLIEIHILNQIQQLDTLFHRTLE